MSRRAGPTEETSIMILNAQPGCENVLNIELEEPGNPSKPKGQKRPSHGSTIFVPFSSVPSFA